MKTLIRSSLFVFLLTFGLTSHAATASGSIGMIRHYGSGMLLVYGLTFSDPSALSHCTGTTKAFQIPYEYEKVDQLLSLILTAKATGTSVTVNNLEVRSSCWAPIFTASSFINFN